MDSDLEVVERAPVGRGATYVDWSAIIAGAVVSAAAAFIFISFGIAIGLGVISPWQVDSASATTVGIIGAAWFLASSALAYYCGGYVAGRLRGVWGDTTESEVTTRDALHGAVVWAVGALLFIWIGASTASSVVSGAASLASGVASGAAQVTSASAGAVGSIVRSVDVGEMAQAAVDKLFRSDLINARTSAEELRRQSSRILVRVLADGELSEADQDDLIDLVATHTSLTEAEAEARVDEVVAEAQAAADATADAAEEAATAAQNATLLVGFLVATGFLVSLAAAWFGAVMGGSHRNNNIASAVFVRRRAV